MNDRYGLPSCGRGNTEGKAIRRMAFAEMNRQANEQAAAICKFNKKRERANELRFYKANGTITKKQLQKLQWLESEGY